MYWPHRLIRIEQDIDAINRLVVLGRTMKTWTHASFPGWGSPLALLLTRDWTYEDLVEGAGREG